MRAPGTRKRLNFALMAISLLATSFSQAHPQSHAVPTSSPENITVDGDERGHRVYESEPAAVWNSARARCGGERAGLRERIGAVIQQAAARHQVDPDLVRAMVQVESNFDPFAVSNKGAMGLMQLMPQTARQWNLLSPFDPEQNVDAGVKHLKSLLNNYAGDVTLSLAAYNAGERAVAHSNGMPKFRETQDYLRKIGNIYQSTTRTSIGRQTASEPIHVWRDSRGILCISNTD